jgi:glucokinase
LRSRQQPKSASRSIRVYVLGVDLGGTFLRAACAQESGAILDEQSELVDGGLTAPVFAGRVRELADKLCPDGPAALAVGLPGLVRSDGHLGPTVNVSKLGEAPIRALLEEALDVPTVVENDVNLAALGEQRRGRAAGKRELAFIAVGTGVGLGIVANGMILRGAHGGAGELGLLPLSPGDVASDLAELGPLEAVAGGAGLAQRWSEHTGRNANGHDVLEAAASGDRDAEQLLDEQAQALAMAVRAVQALLDPELIVFGGGIGSRHDVFSRVQAALARHGVPSPTLELSGLGERAGAIGAVEAALDAARTSIQTLG